MTPWADACGCAATLAGGCPSLAGSEHRHESRHLFVAAEELRRRSWLPCRFRVPGPREPGARVLERSEVSAWPSACEAPRELPPLRKAVRAQQVNTEAMRILLLSTYFEPDIASTGVLMSLLARELVEVGHAMTVVTSLPHYGGQGIASGYRGRFVCVERRGGLRICRVRVHTRAARARVSGRLLNYASFNLLSGVAAALAGRHDIILTPSPPLTNGMVADLVGRLWRVPFVYNVQDVWPDVILRAGLVKNPQAIALLQWVERYVYQRAAAISVIGEGFRRNIISKGVPDRKIRVIPNFFDTDFVRPLNRRNPFSRAFGLDDRFVVLFAGNIGHSQGLETVLNAARMLAQLDDILFLVVGDGAGKPSAEACARELQLSNVRFLPFQPREALPHVYASADVCLVPLRRGFTAESVPSKVFAIMASGRPLIAGVDEGSDTWTLVQTAGCGCCVQPEDPAALAGAIETLYADGELRQQLGRNGRTYVERHHTPRAVAEQYNTLLLEVARSRAASAPLAAPRGSPPGGHGARPHADSEGS